MTQVNMLKAKTELSKLVHLLETNQEDVIYIVRNGEPIVEMWLTPKQSLKRIGVANGKYQITI